MILKSLLLSAAQLALLNAGRINVVCEIKDTPSTETSSSSGSKGNSAKFTETATGKATGAAASSPSTTSGGSSASSSSSPTDKPANSSVGSDKKISFEQFSQAVAAYATSGLGTPPKPPQSIYDEFIKQICSKLDLYEAAMLMANCVWETAGLQHTEEIACKTGTCGYGKYYGRGFLQLTWDYNYKEASKDIYGDENKYLSDPDLVAKSEDAWKTALWFWKKRVQPVLQQNDAVKKGLFGYTIKVINGGLECPANEKAQYRLKIFNAIKKAWNIDGPEGVMTGC